jgi:hypothetical protein
MFTFGIAYWQPLIAICAGLLILLEPRIIGYVVAVYLITVGLIGLHVIS